MSMKTFLVWLVAVLSAVVLIVVWLLFGSGWLKNDPLKNEPNSGSVLAGLFASSKEISVEFVEINNVVVTLRGGSGIEHYLLLELVLVTDSPKKTKRLQQMSPAIRGATVNLLSGMNYDQVRTLSVEKLRDSLMAAYHERLNSLNSPELFTEVIISKMVFQ